MNLEINYPKPENSPEIPNESPEYIYSECLKAYIALEPLKIDETVAKAAAECGIKLSWDDEGRINKINLTDAKKLTENLGASLLNPAEYWQVLTEAKLNHNERLIEELQSNQYAEWLDVVYQKDADGNTWAIDHPKINQTENGYEFDGNKVKIEVPAGRPGWFNPILGINKDTGIPNQIDTKRGKGSRSWVSNNWKFWSFYNCDQGIPVAPIRNWVISSGTPSLDMDLPVFASEEALMVRIVRKQLPEPPIEQKLMDVAGELIQKYLATTVESPAIQNPLEHEKFYQDRLTFFNFLETYGKQFVRLKDKQIQKISDKFIDMLGLIKVMALTKGDENTVNKVNTLAHELYGTGGKTELTAFTDFIRNTQVELIQALEKNQKIVFVMGHKNPDTDTVVSALFEAYRNRHLDNESVFIPVVQGDRIPDEIKRLLGAEIAKNIVLTNSPDYEKAVKSGIARWIMVDQNVSEIQRFAISIVDHHLLSQIARKQNVSKTWEMAGSTCALVMQKFYGMGIDLDPDLSRIMYGATLMDTENRSMRKMTYKDKLIMDLLKNNSELPDEQAFFQDLMSYLLNTDDARLLFERDYKQDWGIFGFAVAKVKGTFDQQGKVVKKELLDNLVNLSIQNNQAKNFPLTITKVADYMSDNETVNKERIYLIFNEYVLPEFKETMRNFIIRVINHEFKGQAKIEVGENFIDYSGVGDQLSRKVTAPYLEPLVNAFNEFYYSPATGLYVSREMLKVSPEVDIAARKAGISLSWDRQNRINNITFDEAKILLRKMGFTMLSLKEYWQILSEVRLVHDEQLTAHLRSKGFVEFMDTVIVDKNQIINHPKIILNNEKIEYAGEIEKIEIPLGLPGLIHETDINEMTGFPNQVYPPTHYGDKTMIRYWSPDTALCIPTRGYIFLLGQSALDCKIHPDDAFPQLGIRPCTRKVDPPQVKIVEDNSGVHAIITK